MIDRLTGFSFPSKLLIKIKKDQEFYLSNKTTFEHPAIRFLNCVLDSASMNEMDFSKFIECLYLNYLINLSTFFGKLSQDGLETRNRIEQEQQRVIAKRLIKDMSKIVPQVFSGDINKTQMQIEEWNEFVEKLDISVNYKILLSTQTVEELYSEVVSLYYKIDGLYSRHKKTA